MRSTFTILLTLEHDEKQGHSESRMAEIVQCAMEEGTSCSGGFASAQVDAFKAVRLTEATLAGSDLARYKNIIPLHR